MSKSDILMMECDVGLQLVTQAAFEAKMLFQLASFLKKITI